MITKYTNEDLLKLLKEFLSNFDFHKINHYFATDYCDEFTNENDPIQNYLNDEFFDIDMMFHNAKDMKKIEIKTKEVLTNAIKMLENLNLT